MTDEKKGEQAAPTTMTTPMTSRERIEILTEETAEEGSALPTTQDQSTTQKDSSSSEQGSSG